MFEETGNKPCHIGNRPTVCGVIIKDGFGYVVGEADAEGITS